MRKMLTLTMGKICVEDDRYKQQSVDAQEFKEVPSSQTLNAVEN